MNFRLTEHLAGRTVARPTVKPVVGRDQTSVRPDTKVNPERWPSLPKDQPSAQPGTSPVVSPSAPPSAQPVVPAGNPPVGALRVEGNAVCPSCNRPMDTILNSGGLELKCCVSCRVALP